MEKSQRDEGSIRERMSAEEFNLCHHEQIIYC